MWLTKEGASIGALEAGTAGAEILHRSSDRLRRLIFEAFNVTIADPEKLGTGDLSARSLAILFQSMVDFADALRDCWGGVLQRVLSPLLRQLVTRAAATGGVYLPGVDVVAAQPILRKFLVAFADGSTRWMDPPVDLAWGAYFDPSQAERQAGIASATQATGGKPVLSLRSAVQSVASMMGVEDVVAEVEAIERENGIDTERAGALLEKLQPGDEDAAPAPPALTMTEGESVQASALNGAQVSSLMEIVQKVALREMPRATGIQLITAAFPIDAAGAEQIMGTVGITFFVQAEGSGPAPDVTIE
jgi:hypothetical protein